MHTTLCAFDARADAEQAMELLVEAGFSRRDMHVEHRPARAAGPQPAWGSRLPAAGDRDALEAFGRFMDRLVGEDPAAQGTSAGRQVERDSYVLVVDAPSAEHAQLVRRLLRALADDPLHLADDVQRPPGLRYADDDSSDPSAP